MVYPCMRDSTQVQGGDGDVEPTRAVLSFNSGHILSNLLEKMSWGFQATILRASWRVGFIAYKRGRSQFLKGTDQHFYALSDINIRAAAVATRLFPMCTVD